MKVVPIRSSLLIGWLLGALATGLILIGVFKPSTISEGCFLISCWVIVTVITGGLIAFCKLYH